MFRRPAVAFAGLALSGLVLSGCAATHNLFTDPTGTITIDRQEFINTYAVITVLYKRLYEQIDTACAKGEAPVRTCERLPFLDDQVRDLNIKIQAKILVPESEIDWATVAKLLSALISLVP